MLWAKGSTAHNCQNCLRLRSQVALRIVKSANCVTKKSELTALKHADFL